jgi:predicted DNA-binding antitoxin AbrB/MazE fold protein
VFVTVQAIYEKGILKLLEPLPLKDREVVQVTVDIGRNWAERRVDTVGFTVRMANTDDLAISPELDDPSPEERP